MADVIPISDKLRDARESLLRDYLEAQNSGDVDGVVATFAHPRVELIASSRVLDGADEVRQYFEERKKAFPDQHVDVIGYHHSDSVVVVEYWMTGTHEGPLHGVEATGKKFRARMAAFFQFEGEQLVGSRIYYDAGTIARQLA